MRGDHLAQANFGRLRAPLESPIMEGFRTQLDPVNALADRSAGFVWRLKTEDGNSMAIRPYPDDDLMAMTMSVWESLESLQAFVYQGDHVAALRDRKQWFEHMDGPILVLWWIPAGQIPTVPEGVARLEYLKEHGPTAHAFTFRTPFPAPGGQGEAAEPLASPEPARVTPFSRVLLVSGLAVLVFDTAGSVAAQAIGFSYQSLSPISFLIYIAAGIAGARAAGFGSGVLAGTVTALIEATAGWAISWVIGPGRPPGGSPGILALLNAVLVVTVTGTIFGVAGAGIGRLSVARKRSFGKPV